MPATLRRSRATWTRQYPATGQTWQDCDKRCKGERTILVLMVVNEGGRLKARVGVYKNGVDTGRRSSIAIKRFIPTSTGYRYISTATKAEDTK